ncbi:peptidoglycan hydrolase CwlO-like protein [Nocardia sp. GAS34]
MSDIEQEPPAAEETGATEGEQSAAEEAAAPAEAPAAEETGATEGEQSAAGEAAAPTEAPAEEAGT